MGTRALGAGTGTVNVIVSESLARQLNGQAIGAKLFFRSQPHVVIGVVGDVKQENYRDDDLPAVYIPPNTFDSFESLILRFLRALPSPPLRFGKPFRSSTQRSSSPRFIQLRRCWSAHWRPKYSGLAVLSCSVRRQCSWPWQDYTRLVDGQPINDVRSARFASRSARARRILPDCWAGTRLSRRSLASSSGCHSR